MMCLQGHLTEFRPELGSIHLSSPNCSYSHMDLLSRALELGSRSNVAKDVVEFTACRRNSMECNGTGFVKELVIGLERHNERACD